MKDFVLSVALTGFMIAHVIIYAPPFLIPVMASLIAMAYFVLMINLVKTPHGCAFLLFETLTIQFLVYALLILFYLVTLRFS